MILEGTDGSQNIMFLQILQEISTQDEREIFVVLWQGEAPVYIQEIGLVLLLLSELFWFVTN